jgi:post-segregation antitoxin (ccd killing protein)
MTEVTMTLPDTLAQEARAAGLLTPQALETMLRETLRKQRVDELFTAMDKMAAVEMPAMTEAEIQLEIEAARTERRARRS